MSSWCGLRGRSSPSKFVPDAPPPCLCPVAAVVPASSPGSAAGTHLWPLRTTLRAIRAKLALPVPVHFVPSRVLISARVGRRIRASQGLRTCPPMAGGLCSTHSTREIHQRGQKNHHRPCVQNLRRCAAAGTGACPPGLQQARDSGAYRQLDRRIRRHFHH